MNDEARKARNKYMREWREKNKDKLRKNVNDYWERKASKEKEESNEERSERDE